MSLTGGQIMGKHKEIDQRGWSAADPDTIYALLADGSTWPVWSPIRTFELRETGADGAGGLGAIRVFRTGRATSVERVAELQPGRRFSYELVSGLPLREYRADIDLEPSNGGTAIRWHSTFFPERRGTGWFYRSFLSWFIGRCVRGLARHASGLAAASRSDEQLADVTHGRDLGLD
jgi:hypothetical protein